MLNMLAMAIADRTSYSSDAWTSEKYDRLSQQQLGFLYKFIHWLSLVGLVPYAGYFFFSLSDVGLLAAILPYSLKGN